VSKKICVVIPSRNETLLTRTVKQYFSSAKNPDDIKIDVILDGWDIFANNKSNQAIIDIYRKQIEEIKQMAESDQRITIHDLPDSLGVRHALNLALAKTDATYFIKLDAHCDLSPNWDVELIKSYEEAGLETLIIPRIRSMDPETFVYGTRFFDYLYIDSNIHQRHWPEYAQREEAQKPVCEVMSNLGASWFSSVQYWWQLGGHDESLYGWGESAPETSLKCWLSGGRQLLNKNVWFAHVFRRRFPYKVSAAGIQENKKRTKEYWLNNQYPLQIHTIDWLVNKFRPVPTWDKEQLKNG